MNFYEIYILSYIFTYFSSVCSVSNLDLKISDVGIKNVSPCVIGLILYAVVNNTSNVDDYDVELLPDQCCLELGSNIDCEVLQAYGNCLGNLPKGSVKTFTLVVPVLDPYERTGYCLANLDSKSVNRKSKKVTMRDAIKIPFDTRLKNYHLLPTGIKLCKGFDEDPLNYCKRVNCEVFYNENKSFYDRKQKRCVEVPYCVSHEGDTQHTILNPFSNKCLADEPITRDDIDYIKSIKHNSNKDRIVKDIVIIKKFKEGPVNVTEFYEKMAENPQKHSLFNKKGYDKNWYPSTILCMVSKNRSSVTFLFFIIVLQCGLICTMIYFMARKCFCKKGTILEKKYFNYRQDASVTTPLIGVTTIDTDTTCQFTSESSHIEKKIQCYKACQKENAKVSLSDDILTKCLNRRNWDRKQVRSEAVDEKTDNYKTLDTLYMSTKKGEQRVNFENDKEFRNKDDIKTKPTGRESKKIKDDKSVTEYEINCLTYNEDGKKIKDEDKFTSEFEIKCFTYNDDSRPKLTDDGLSEKEIGCHSYNYGMGTCHVLKSSSHSYSTNQRKKSQIFTAVHTSNRNGSIARQASAQASFSNDSIDDFLSERGMLFLEGDNTSKYSFSDISGKSSVSSKTSKNIMKHVLSYLKRDKHRPSSSYPDVKKNEEEEVNLELIHMSKATMYSSSNNGTECTKNISRVKDSRTSL